MTTRLLQSPLFIAGSIIALLSLFTALFGGFFMPNDPLKTDIYHTLAAPGGAYPLGTDELGRCVLSRIIAGGRATLGAAFTIEAVILVAGLCFGICAGYCGGFADAVISTLIDILLAFPSLILALVIAGIFGAGLHNLMLAMMLVYWVEPARIARSIALSLRKKEFVTAARASGSGGLAIIIRHILPHVLPNMLIYAALNVSSIIIGLSSMSFIGLGARPPQPEWGALLFEQRSYMRENPAAIIVTISCVMLSVAAFQFLGEAARDSLHPRKNLLGTCNARLP